MVRKGWNRPSLAIGIGAVAGGIAGGNRHGEVHRQEGHGEREAPRRREEGWLRLGYLHDQGDLGAISRLSMSARADRLAVPGTLL